MADNGEEQQAEMTEEVPAQQMEQETTEDTSTQGASGDAEEAGGEQPAEIENGAEEKQAAGDDDEDSDEDDEDERKLFVGGLSWETQESGLKEHMEQYGVVDSCTVKTDPQSGRSRCFGFVVFKEVGGLEKALEDRPHKVDGKKIDSKKAEPQRREGKLFVGGVKPETDDEKIREYFQQFGKIVKIDRPKDSNTKKYKAFCFITFKKDGAVAKITKQRYHQLDDKDVECKFADPPFSERNSGGGRGRGRGRGGGYGGPAFGGFNYGGFPNPYGNFHGGFGSGFGGGPWGPGFPGPFGGGGYPQGNFGAGYGGGYGYSGGQSNFGKANRGGGGRHQNNFKPY